MTPQKIKIICAFNGGQCAVARLIGVDPRTVRRWCSGKTVPRGAALFVLHQLSK